ncbi:OmpH family outer membrane protein [Cereibacter sphaeroides]|uniref:OmpH family outer membrane protein n=1 Tax=Rhodobacterales TaxID=204455 RepID=UPI000BBEC8A5|nr:MULTISPECIES: OmpH family outer membrane protein [Paracoccaceae]MCE6953185.1 OmpH family outer membrane protein [Cereibacter sphaeroides]MCE6961714.1 OmpH family outer membrane protein [Cereibacter sphaeroides]MCE6970490.1 OmpH family outer membrane protein [Cereibacter sphaeroides]MCE6975064.1 OmpH family outer membrane protein [Cereibacter sphaeroides]
MQPVAAAALALALVLPAAARAQNVVPTQPSGVVVIDQGRLISDTALGQGVERRFQSASRSLVAENRRIEAALEAEERALTARRSTLQADSFRDLAAEFDRKVEGIRQAQEAKSRALTRQRDEERQRIVERAVPILAQIMEERSASVLIDRAAVVLSRDAADITEEAIARLDRLAAEAEPPGSGPEAAPPAPAADPAPPPAPGPDTEPQPPGSAP